MDQIFNNTCEVFRAENANEGGIVKKNWRQVGAYLCRINGISSKTPRTQNMTEGVISDNRKLFTIGNADIKTSDKLQIDELFWRVDATHLNRDNLGKVKFLTCLISKIS